MNGKITLITPPDIFENESKSILFIHLSEKDQENVSKWLGEASIDEDLNIYFYDGTIDIQWLLYAVARADNIFIDLDNLNENTKLLCGFILGKKKVCYATANESVSALCQYINQDRIININDFLERALNAKNG